MQILPLQFLRLLTRWLPLCFLLFLAAGPASAVDPSRLISQYGHTAWRIQDGYFGGRVRTITQTADGYVWIGTRSGLVRFDGVRFVPWTPPGGLQSLSPSITSLLGARDGEPMDRYGNWSGPLGEPEPDQPECTGAN